MKKRALMALPKLTATDEMKQIATSDLPRKEKTDYGYVREVCEYYTYLRCIKQDGILKVAFFFPEHLRLDGSNPAYEVYLDKEKRQFITYNSLIQKWSESKLDRLDWKRQYWYTRLPVKWLWCRSRHRQYSKSRPRSPGPTVRG